MPAGVYAEQPAKSEGLSRREEASVQSEAENQLGGGGDGAGASLAGSTAVQGGEVAHGEGEAQS